MAKTTQIISLALIVAALLTSACGCNSEQINTNPADKTKESTSVGETDNTNGETDSTKEETDNTNTKELDTSKLSYCASYDHVTFYKDEQGQYYVKMYGWNTHRNLGNIQGEIRDAVVGEKKIEAIAIKNNREANETVITIITMTRDSEKVEKTERTLDFACIAERDYLLVNYYKENCACLIFVPEAYITLRTSTSGKSGDIEEEIEYKYEYWPLLRYETTDGGKTWENNLGEEHVSAGHWNYWPRVLKFVDKEVGIFSYRSTGDEDANNVTYITTDSGKTWSLIAPLEYPFKLYEPYKSAEETGYTYVKDFEVIDNRYVLTLVHTYYRKPHGYDDTYQYATEDFKTWTLIKYTKEFYVD